MTEAIFEIEAELRKTQRTVTALLCLIVRLLMRSPLCGLVDNDDATHEPLV